MATVAQPRTGRFRAPADSSTGALPLAIALGVATLYAAFASGAIDLADEVRLQVLVAVVSMAAIGGLLYRGLRFSAPRTAVAGLVLLGVFAAWSGASITWSIAPDQSWLELNRAISYVLVAGLAVCLGSSSVRAPEWVAWGYLGIAAAVALYALGGKVAPWLNVPGLFDLNHTEQFSRLREPIGYWNGLGLLVALAIPLAIRVAVDQDGLGRKRRMAALALSVPLGLCLVLTYSRGGVLAALVGLALVTAAGPDRLRVVLAAAIGACAAAPAMVIGLSAKSLTTDSLPVADRTNAGLLLLGLLALGMAAAAFAGTRLLERANRITVSPAARKWVVRGGLATFIVAGLVAVVAVAASDRGVSGTVGDQQRQFSVAEGQSQTDPGRLLQTNSANRASWWGEAVGAWSERKLEGHGAGSFRLLHLAFRDDGLEVRQAHSVPLQWLAETGIVGLLLGLGGLAALMWAAFTGLRERSGRERAYAVALGAGVAAWTLHMWVDWDWDIPAAALPFLIFLGVLAARPRLHRPPPPGRVGPAVRGALLLLAAVPLIACGVSAVLPALANSDVREAADLSLTGKPADLVEAASVADTAHRLNPLSVEPLFIGAAIAERRNQFARESRLLQDALELQPRNPAVWARTARFEIVAGDDAAAVQSAQRWSDLDPLNNAPRLVIGIGNSADLSASAWGTPLPQTIPLSKLGKTPTPSKPPDLPTKPGAFRGGLDR